jgi:mono/diheme cytochrome c family protein
MRKPLFVLCLFALGACSDSTTSADMGDIGQQVALAARGQYLITALIDCGGCHTSDPTKPFGGGVQFPIDANGSFVTSRNLTPDPDTGLKLTEDQFVQVFQTGADFTNPGQQLVVMPWYQFRWMTVDDIRAIYAVLQHFPAANNKVPPDQKGPAALAAPIPMPDTYNEGDQERPLPPTSSQLLLGPPNVQTPVPDPGNALRGAAIFPLSYDNMPAFKSRPADEQAAFGRGAYLVNAAACSDCHTNKNGFARDFTPGPTFLKIPTDAYLQGGGIFSVPAPLNPVLKQTRSMSANLIGPSGFFNEPDTTFLLFASIIDQMAHVDDDPPLPLGWPMPADHFRNLSAQDLEDIYTYMKVLAEDYDHTLQTDKVTQATARYCTTNADCEMGETCFIDNAEAKLVNNQCVGKACMSDDDCDACQTCSASACAAPDPASVCLKTGR